jgi:hypothetical protein
MHQLHSIKPENCKTNPCFQDGRLVGAAKSKSGLCILSVHQCPPESSLKAELDSQTTILLSVNTFPVTVADDEACK